MLASGAAGAAGGAPIAPSTSSSSQVSWSLQLQQLVRKLPLLQNSSSSAAAAPAMSGGAAAKPTASGKDPQAAPAAAGMQLLRSKAGGRAGAGNEPLSVTSIAAAAMGNEGEPAQAAVPVQMQHSRFALCWWLTQQAAHYCVTSRLHTQFGGPSHSFSALEQLLQRMLLALKSPGSSGAAGGGVGSSGSSGRGQSLDQVQQQLDRAQQQQQQQPQRQGPQKSWRQQQAEDERQQQKQQQPVQADAKECLPMSDAAPLLLDFMLALESEVQAACEGSVTRQVASGPHLIFFAANARVSDFEGNPKPLLPARHLALQWCLWCSKPCALNGNKSTVHEDYLLWHACKFCPVKFAVADYC